MNWKTWIPLVLAVGLALVAAKLTHDVIAGKKTGTAEGPSNFVQVVVSRGDLPPGATLTKENLTLAPMPGTTAPPHTYTSVNDLMDRVSSQPLVQGQPIDERLLAPKGSGIGLQALVPQGMRAVTIEVNEFTGVANLVAPGMTVDVVGSFRDDTNHDTVSRTIVQNLKVLAVGSRMSATNEDPNQKDTFKSVTLLATPKDAERVELATYSGRPRLVLRSGKDLGAVASKGASLMEILTGGEDKENFMRTLQAIAKSAKPSPSTTQPSEVEAPVKQVSTDPFEGMPRTIQRKVTVIRNGTESTTTFEVPVPKGHDLMIDMPTKEVIDTGSSK